MTSRRFIQEARRAAISWKTSTGLLPSAARVDGTYGRRRGALPFVLPTECASHNLLPESKVAIDLFAAAAIPWHDGVNGGPSNHLLDSQVQCVNALAPLAHDSDAIRAVFGDALDFGKALPSHDPADPDGFISFEWIGTDDPLGEWPPGGGTRGAKNTSADAAIRYVTTAGVVELALIEWKYTESYLGDKAELTTSKTSTDTRDRRYKHRYFADDGPLRTDVMPYEDLYVEPFYQLMRLTLLAREIERRGDLADRVRLVYCAPKANSELWASCNRSSHGIHVGARWTEMQRDPWRFVMFDTAALVTPDALTSPAFKARYGHLARGDR